MSPKPVYTLFAWGIPANAYKDGYQVIEVVAGEDNYILIGLKLCVGNL